jgi:hypothetical protein
MEETSNLAKKLIVFAFVASGLFGYSYVRDLPSSRAVSLEALPLCEPEFSFSGSIPIKPVPAIVDLTGVTSRPPVTTPAQPACTLTETEDGKFSTGEGFIGNPPTIPPGPTLYLVDPGVKAKINAKTAFGAGAYRTNSTLGGSIHLNVEGKRLNDVGFNDMYQGQAHLKLQVQGKDVQFSAKIEGIATAPDRFLVLAKGSSGGQRVTMEIAASKSGGYLLIVNVDGTRVFDNSTVSLDTDPLLPISEGKIEIG